VNPSKIRKPPSRDETICNSPSPDFDFSALSTSSSNCFITESYASIREESVPAPADLKRGGLVNMMKGSMKGSFNQFGFNNGSDAAMHIGNAAADPSSPPGRNEEDEFERGGSTGGGGGIETVVAVASTTLHCNVEIALKAYLDLTSELERRSP
jgi:hypothetical protein